MVLHIQKFVANITFFSKKFLGMVDYSESTEIFKTPPRLFFYGWTILPDWIIVIVILLGSWLTFCKLYSGGMIACSYCCIF